MTVPGRLRNARIRKQIDPFQAYLELQELSAAWRCLREQLEGICFAIPVDGVLIGPLHHLHPHGCAGPCPEIFLGGRRSRSSASFPVLLARRANRLSLIIFMLHKVCIDIPVPCGIFGNSYTYLRKST